jgi:hypothetical protein
MPRLPGVKPREVVRFLERHGFVLDHTSGSRFTSYNQLLESGQWFQSTIGYGQGGALLSLLREAGITREELIEFLRIQAFASVLSVERSFDQFPPRDERTSDC